jgi:hypothetical protein
MVDTGAESTWVDATVLEAIGIERRQKDLQFQLADGQVRTRSVGYAVLTVDKSETVDEVVFAERDDLAGNGWWLPIRSSVQPPYLRDSDSWCRSPRDHRRVVERLRGRGRKGLGTPD